MSYFEKMRLIRKYKEYNKIREEFMKEKPKKEKGKVASIGFKIVELGKLLITKSAKTIYESYNKKIEELEQKGYKLFEMEDATEKIVFNKSVILSLLKEYNWLQLVGYGFIAIFGISFFVIIIVTLVQIFVDILIGIFGAIF